MKNSKYYATVRRKLLNRIGIEDRTAWRKGVNLYAQEMLIDVFDIIDNYGEDIPMSMAELKSMALNGARDWKEFSYSGVSLNYDCDIAKRLCNPTELKRVKGGELRPNRDENWLDVQARALYQAFILLNSLFWI